MRARWTTEKELAELIQAKAGQGKVVSLTPETALKIAQKLLKAPAPDPHLKSLSFRLEVWSDTGSQIVETLAAAHSYGLIVLVYDAAQGARPKDRLVVRQGTRVIKDSGPPDPDAPRNVVQLR